MITFKWNKPFLIRVQSLLGLGLIALLVITACSKKYPDNAAIIARVGENYLTDVQLNDYTPGYLSADAKKAFQSEFVKEWINEKILLNYFQKNNIVLDARDEALIARYRYELLYSRFIKSISPEITKPTDMEISSYYKEHKDEFQRDQDEVHLILLFLEQPNIGIQDDIKHNQSLMEVIEKNFLESKISNQIEKNGDLGYIPVSGLRKEISRAVQRYKSGKISRAIKTNEGIYYIQVLDYQKEGSYRELPLVRNEIAHRISQNKFDKHINNVIQQETNNLVIDKFYDKLN